MQILLSIDGGSSSTKAGFINIKNEKVVKDYTIPRPFNYQSIIDNTYLNILSKLLDNKDIVHTILGISGIDTNNELKNAKLILQRHFPKNNFTVVNDIELVENTVKNKNRIAIISGTGSNCIGTNGINNAKAGGLDYILSDQGSGYYIGTTALKIATKMLDGRKKPSVLSREVLKRFNTLNLQDLKNIIHTNKLQKKDFSKITLDVVKCSVEYKDLESKKILKKAAHELFLHINAVAQNLKMEDFIVICAGSVFKIKYVKEYFEKEVLFYYDNATFYYPTQPTYLAGINIYKKL